MSTPEINPLIDSHRTRAVYSTDKTRLELTWRTNIFAKEKRKLEIGDLVIGRQDENQPSNLEVKDEYMSLRSVIIRTTCDGGVYSSQLELLRASNQALYNGRPLNIGEIIYLNAGDTFQLGRTTFNVNKVK